MLLVLQLLSAYPPTSAIPVFNLLSTRFLFADHLLLSPSRSTYAYPRFLPVIYLPLCVHIIRRRVRTAPCVVEPPLLSSRSPLSASPLFLISTSPRISLADRKTRLPLPFISAFCFWVLCGLKLYLGAIVLCIHTYTYDLHVHLAISSASTVFLYPCIPSHPCVYRTYPLEHVNVRRRME